MYFPELFLIRKHRQFLFWIGSAICLLVVPAFAAAQKEDKPTFSDYKGVQIGMRAEDARKKLGSPRDKSAEQDFYMVNDNQAVTVFYDKSGTVNAISIDFMDGASGIPTCKDILGAETEAKSDGSMYKLTRYPKAGYWVSYSRTAGNSPTVTITMQKIDH